MIRKIISYLFACILLAVIWTLWNCEEEPVCNEVVRAIKYKKKQQEPVCNKVSHSVKPPSFTAKQEQIIDKYRDIIHSKLLDPDAFFILSVKEHSNKTYSFVLFPLRSLQEYRMEYYWCGSGMSLDSDVWFTLNESGEIIDSNEWGHPWKEAIFR